MLLFRLLAIAPVIGTAGLCGRQLLARDAASSVPVTKRLDHC
jgi:hypothetical protein